MWSTQVESQRQYYESIRSKHTNIILKAQQIGCQEAVEARESTTYRELRELEQVIRKDCTRTFSDYLFFKSSVIQDLVVRLVLVFSAEHPEMGYKQGMTDILAVLLLCLFCERNRHGSGEVHVHTWEILDSHLKYQKERLEKENETAIHRLYVQGGDVICRSEDQQIVFDVLNTLTDERYLEHDCYILLERLMTLLRGCYVDGDVCSLTHRIDHVMWLVEQCEMDEKTIEKIGDMEPTQIQDSPSKPDKGDVIKKQTLLSYLNENGILPSMFLLRWIRLLLSREVSVEAVFFLWDRLFILPDPALPLLDYMSASLLLTLRDSIYACEGIQSILNLLQEGRRNVNVHFIWEVCQVIWRVI